MSELVVTRDVLDTLRCANPGCTCTGPLYLTPKCHPSRGIDATYFDGVVTVRCKHCAALVVAIQVASANGSGVLQDGSQPERKRMR